MAAVVGFLVISFAIWGIGDIFRGFGRSTVAKIGHTEITIEQFRSLYNDRLQQYSRQFGRPITADQARATGLDRAVIGQIFSEILLDEPDSKDALRFGFAGVNTLYHCGHSALSLIVSRCKRIDRLMLKLRQLNSSWPCAST